MGKKPSKPKAIWAVSPTLGKTRFPVTPVPTYEEWTNATLAPGRIKFSKFITDCTRCRSCEVICAFYREKVNNPLFSRIRIVAREVEWLEGKTDRIVERKICRQCPGIPECILACPIEGALSRDSETGAVVVNDELCIRCKKCVEACPYDAIWYNQTADRILKCDLCGGKPKCVTWCPVECLQFERVA